MDLKAKIDEDLKTALKDKDTLKVSVLRLLKSAISYKEIDKQEELTDGDLVSVIEKEAKKRRESVEAFRGHRDDLADKEQQELEILEGYLPEGMSDEETIQIIEEVSAKQNFDKKDFGRLMGAVMGKLKKTGKRVDGSKVKELLHKYLDTNK